MKLRRVPEWENWSTREEEVWEDIYVHIYIYIYIYFYKEMCGNHCTFYSITEIGETFIHSFIPSCMGRRRRRKHACHHLHIKSEVKWSEGNPYFFLCPPHTQNKSIYIYIYKWYGNIIIYIFSKLVQHKWNVNIS